MENNLQVFNNSEFGQVRTIEEEGKVLFCASDIAKALGYTRPSDAVSQHCRATVKHRIGVQTGIKANGEPAIQNIEMSFISESDVYRLIIKSKLPTAEKFERWVFDEVLPSINKTGAYMTPETIEKVLLNPDTIISLATQIKQLQADNQYKTELIQCHNRELSFAEMRQVINRVVRKVPKYIERWSELYRQFNMKYHMNVQQRAKNKNVSALEYIDSAGMIPELFDIACKLYESEVNSLVQEMYGITA